MSGAITFTLDGQEVTARPGELVVHPERVVGEEKPAREQRPITVMINVTAADGTSFRASEARSRLGWLALLTGSDAACERHSVPGAMEMVKVLASWLPTAAAAKLLLEVGESGVRRVAVLQERGADGCRVKSPWRSSQCAVRCCRRR